MEKSEVRKILKNAVVEMGSECRKKESSLVCSNFLHSHFYADCKSVFSYFPLSLELDVSEINLQVLKDGKNLFLPRCGADGSMEFFKICNDVDFFDQFVKGAYGIFEPKPGLIKASSSDFSDSCFLVPGWGFSKDGNRIGKGKGFYDRYFSNLNSDFFKIGIHFSCQLLLEIPSEAHDMKMDFLLGPEGFITSGCQLNSI